LVIPFTGSQRNNRANDAFNYFLSQLRIRVEMVFGLLVNKFRILSGKVLGSLERITAILCACARLHNYIIKQDGPFDDIAELEEENKIVADPDAPFGMAYLPVVPNEDFEVYDGTSFTREAIVDYIKEYDIGRPLHNIKRREAEAASLTSANDTEWEREFISS